MMTILNGFNSEIHDYIYRNNEIVGFKVKQVSINKKVIVISHDKRVVTSVDEELSITSEMRDGDGNLMSDFNDSFVMPIKRVGGSVEKSLLMEFINGVCTRSVAFNQSGEYEVTKEIINLHLDSELDFDGFNISVYE